MTPARQPMVHELKTWPDAYQAIADGCKKHELRKNDRDFRILDVLRLREWDPETESYTGRSQSVLVTYVHYGDGTWGLEDGYCIMSIVCIA